MMSRNDATSPPPQTIWHVRMLGGLVAMSMDSSLPGDCGSPCEHKSVEQFRTHKTALLLARLALFPQRAHGREELADLLWPDLPADRGRANLTLALVYLRQALGEQKKDGLFLADYKTIRVVKGRLKTDVATWEAGAAHALTVPDDHEPSGLLSASLSAYTGDLLPGFYDGWVCDERNRLSALHDALYARLQALQASPAAVGTTPNSLKRISVPIDATPKSAVIMNAPLYLTRFFGRIAESTSAGELLRQELPVRLLTLLGTGGIGKTRLALYVARTVLHLDAGNASQHTRFGWAAFVPLSEARTPVHMEEVLLRVLGIQGTDMDGFTAVVNHLNGRAARSTHRLLLILDNMEQLAEASAPVVTRLLSDVPALTILATSRQPLGATGEQEVTVGPLQSAPLTQDNAHQSNSPPAVALFIDRARLVRPEFSITSQNRAAVGELCGLLEGIPLALELAAPWIRSLTPTQITARLKNRFDLLTRLGASGDSLPQRHQSLRAAIAWSYDLLPFPQQTLWAQLSVFRGGWTLEAAQAVSGIEDLSMPLLLLAERSLILTEIDEATGMLRYRMLESLREFAEEQRPSWGDACESLRLRHARYFETLSCQAEQMIKKGRGNRDALVLLGPERDNIGAALRFTLDPAQTKEAAWIAGIRLALQSFWLRSCVEQAECLRQAADGLDSLSDAIGIPLKARILFQQGNMSRYLGNPSNAEQKFRASLDLWSDLGDGREVVTVKMSLGSVLRWTDLAKAVALWTECIDFARRNGEPLVEAAALNNLANADGDLAQRRAWIEQAVALDRRHSSGSDLLACSLNSMGGIAFEQGDFMVTRACLEEAHQIAVSDGGAGMMGVTKMALVELFLATSEHLDRAETLAREAYCLFVQKGEPPRVVEALRLRFQIALRRGDADAALDYVRQQQGVSRDAALRDDAELTDAQAEMASALRNAGFAQHAAAIQHA